MALPAVTAPAGFGPSAATMVACWALLAAEALLLAEVNLAVRAQKVRHKMQFLKLVCLPCDWCPLEPYADGLSLVVVVTTDMDASVGVGSRSG